MTTIYGLGVLIVLLTVYWFPVRRRFSRWGSTAADLERQMPGDALVPEPTFVTTLGITY